MRQAIGNGKNSRAAWFHRIGRSGLLSIFDVFPVGMKLLLLGSSVRFFGIGFAKFDAPISK
jgi:hypothetical protein